MKSFKNIADSEGVTLVSGTPAAESQTERAVDRSSGPHSQEVAEFIGRSIAGCRFNREMFDSRQPLLLGQADRH